MRSVIGDASTAGASGGERGVLAAGAAAGAAEREGPERLAGRSVGKYELLAEVARGGMGVVYKARDSQLQRIVALKMVLSGQFASDREVTRFLGEAQAAAHLDHTGIVPIYEIGEHDGQPFFSMAFVDGCSLQARLKDGPLPAREAAEMVRAVAEAVHFAHRRGVVHRDLKPQNILLDQAGQPKVTDFGLAKRLDRGDELTATGAVMGTPPYMAPEQAAGKNTELGPLVDVYALGALLYATLTGRPPFHAATLAETLRQVIHEDPVSPRLLNPATPQDLETICLKCLAKEPPRRYGSAAEVGADLQRYLAGEPIRARRTPAWERLAKWARRRPAAALLIAATLVSLVSLAVGGLFYAEAANQRAVLAEKELLERRTLDELRHDSQVLLLRGEQAMESGNLQEARVSLEKVLAKLGARPELAKERDQADRIMTELQRRLAASRELAEARARLTQFQQHRDAALFFGSQSFGLDPQRHRERARQAAELALGLFGLPDAAAEISTVHYTAAEQAVLKTQCYELLLVRAESLAQTAAPDGAGADVLRAAVRTVDRAAALRRGATKAAHLQKAEYLSRLGDPSAADERRLSDDESAHPETAADFFLVGKLLLRNTTGQAAELAQARVHLEQALRVEPDHFWAQYCLGMCLLRVRRPDLAQVHFTACAVRRPDFAWTHVLRGAAQSELQEYTLAEADFQRVLELEPDDEARYVTLVNWGVMEYRRDRFLRAEELLQQAINLRPREFQAHLSLAKSLQRQDKFSAALESLHTAISLEPRLPTAYRERARLLHQQGDLDAARADLEAAIQREPGTSAEKADDLTRLGEICVRRQQPDEALKVFSQAVACAPESPPAHLWRGVVLVQLRRYAEALPDFDAYAQRGKPTLEFYLTRGTCRASLGKYPDAIADFTRAIELAPTADTHSKRGWLYALRGNPLIARDDFERALAFDPDHQDARCGRGLVLARLARTDEAVADAEKYLVSAAPSSQTFYKAACIFAVAAVRVPVTTDRNVRQTNALREQYSERAVTLIERSVLHEAPERRSNFWREVIDSDVHLHPLRASPLFTSLRTRILGENASVSNTPSSAESSPTSIHVEP